MHCASSLDSNLGFVIFSGKPNPELCLTFCAISVLMIFALFVGFKVSNFLHLDTFCNKSQDHLDSVTNKDLPALKSLEMSGILMVLIKCSIYSPLKLIIIHQYKKFYEELADSSD